MSFGANSKPLNLFLLGALTFNPSSAYGSLELQIEEPLLPEKRLHLDLPTPEKILIDKSCGVSLKKYRDADLRDLEQFLFISEYSKAEPGFSLEGKARPYYEIYKVCSFKYLSRNGFEFQETNSYDPLLFYSDFEDKDGNKFLVITDHLNHYSVLLRELLRVSLCAQPVASCL